MPQVSIIIPAYNGARFIAATVESGLNQTLADQEIIVVNDGSQDHTAEVLRPYCDRIRYVEQANQGVAVARNHGLSLAQGQFVAFLDQDDIMLPDKLALQVHCFEENPTVGMVHSGWRLIDAADQPMADVEPWQDAPTLDLVGWIRRMPVLLSAMLFRRDWVLRVNGLDSKFQQVCDVDLVQRLALAGCQTCWLRQITTLYRQHDRNDSLNTLLQAEECLAVQEQFFARSDLPAVVRQAESESRYYTLVWLAWRLFHTGHLTQMVDYLKRSLHYTPFLKTETILHWVSSFKRYSTDYGRPFDAESFSRLAEWQELMQCIAAKYCG